MSYGVQSIWKKHVHLNWNFSINNHFLTGVKIVALLHENAKRIGTKISQTNHKFLQIHLVSYVKDVFLHAPDFFRISNALSRGDTQRAIFKQVRRFTEKETHLSRAYLNLKTQCAKQIFNLKKEQWRVFLCKFRHLERFSRFVRSMWKLGVDPWSKTYGLGVTCQDETSKLLCILSLGIFA